MDDRQSCFYPYGITPRFVVIRSGDYYHFEGDPEEEDREFEDLATSVRHSPAPHHQSSEFDPRWHPELLQSPRYSGRGRSSARTSVAASSAGAPRTSTQTSTVTSISASLAPSTGAAATAAESMQRQHIRSAWSNIDSAPLESLSNYTCPYGTAPTYVLTASCTHTYIYGSGRPGIVVPFLFTHGIGPMHLAPSSGASRSVKRRIPWRFVECMEVDGVALFCTMA